MRELAQRAGPYKVWAEVLFADPIADITVLGAPDTQELCEQAMAYEALTEAATPLKLGSAVLVEDRRARHPADGRRGVAEKQ
jgi:hypothetical protein